MEGIGSSHLICSIKKSQAHMCYDGSKTIPNIHVPLPRCYFSAETCVAWVSFCQMAIFWLLVIDPSLFVFVKSV